MEATLFGPRMRWPSCRRGTVASRRSSLPVLSGAGGSTVVVSPLIALQLDQVAALAEAPALHRTGAQLHAGGRWGLRTGDETRVDAEQPSCSSSHPNSWRATTSWSGCGPAEVTPSVVDEAHCISAWGHDLRPDYLTLGAVAQRLGHPTLVALTATASPPVREEIAARLGLRDPVPRPRFDRPNLHLDVQRHVENYEERLLTVVDPRPASPPWSSYAPTRRGDRLGRAVDRRGHPPSPTTAACGRRTP